MGRSTGKRILSLGSHASRAAPRRYRESMGVVRMVIKTRPTDRLVPEMIPELCRARSDGGFIVSILIRINELDWGSRECRVGTDSVACY